jgi:hypothetical protein
MSSNWAGNLFLLNSNELSYLLSVLLFRYHLVPCFLLSFFPGSVLSLSMNCVEYFSIHHIILYYSLYLTLLERLGEPFVVRKPVREICVGDS